MGHPINIAGRSIDIVWNQESAKRFAFRMGEIGGEPTSRQLSNVKTVTTALFKVLWALLPAAELVNYPDPEALFVAVNHDTEAEGIFATIAAIYQERFISPEKKSTSQTSPSPVLS